MHSSPDGDGQRFGTTWTNQSEDIGPNPSLQTVFKKSNFAPGDYATWWDDLHVFRGFWGPDGYSFWIDDTPVG